eukprot:4117752-Pyramimonas_sp.AAC.1
MLFPTPHHGDARFNQARRPRSPIINNGSAGIMPSTCSGSGAARTPTTTKQAPNSSSQPLVTPDDDLEGSTLHTNSCSRASNRLNLFLTAASSW